MPTPLVYRSALAGEGLASRRRSLARPPLGPPPSRRSAGSRRLRLPGRRQREGLGGREVVRAVAREDPRQPAEVLLARVPWPRSGPPQDRQDRVADVLALRAGRGTVVDLQDAAAEGDRPPARPRQAGYQFPAGLVVSLGRSAQNAPLCAAVANRAPPYLGLPRRISHVNRNRRA